MTSINIRKLSHSEMDLYRKPLLPETWSCFPVDRDIDTQQLRKILQKDLDRIRSGAEKDPFSNSITMLALDISRRLEKNKLNYSALEALIQRLAVGSFGLRADRLKSYMGTTEKQKNIEDISKIIKSLAYKNEKLINFDQFNEELEKEIFGIVLTAHPTFGMTYEMMLQLAKLATSKNQSKKLSDKELKLIVKEVFKTEQRPEKKITLDFEHRLSMSALQFLQQSLKTLYEIVVKIAKQLFPKEFHKVKPQIFRLHTWVGYDVDGRGDIFWSDSFSKRIEVKLDQLSLYINSLNKIIKSCKDKNVKAELLRIKLIFTDSITSNSVALRKFSQRGFVENFNAIKDVSNYLHKNKEKLLTNTNSIIKDLDLLINEIIEKK